MKMEVAEMRVARDMIALEQELDQVLARSAQLLATVAEARVATNSPIAQGHRAFARLASLQTKIVEARGDLVRAHADLRKIAERDDMPTECPVTARARDAERIAA